LHNRGGEKWWKIGQLGEQRGGNGDQMKVLLNPSCSLGQKVKLSLNAAQLISFEAAFLAAAVIAVGHRQRQFSH